MLRHHLLSCTRLPICSANDAKWGWVATAPGAWAELALDSRSAAAGGEVDLGEEDRTLPLAQKAARSILDAYNGKRPPVTGDQLHTGVAAWWGGDCGGRRPPVTGDHSMRRASECWDVVHIMAYLASG